MVLFQVECLFSKACGCSRAAEANGNTQLGREPFSRHPLMSGCHNGFAVLMVRVYKTQEPDESTNVSYGLSRVRLFVTPWTPIARQAPLILQAGILEWVVIPFSRGSFRLRDQTCVS